MEQQEHTLAERLGLTRPAASLLLRKAAQIAQRYPSCGAVNLEDWLLDVANARGADIVSRNPGAGISFLAPPEDVFSNEELCGALCHPSGADRPQILRVAAQLITRGDVCPVGLNLIAVRERLEPVLSELAFQALHVEADHAVWRQLASMMPRTAEPRSPILHWNRLSWPKRQSRRSCKQEWMLVR